MDADLVAEPDAGELLRGSSILAAIKASGVEFILSVPDIVTSGGLLRPIARDPALKLIRVCKEDECIGIACGLAYCDRRALTLIQHTGFLDSINAIRGIAVILASVDVPDAGYFERAPCCSPFGGYRNSLYFSPKGQHVGIDYLTDLVAALREHHAPLQAVMAWEIQQEQFVLGDVKPLSLAGGTVTTADGRSYDMSDESAKRAMTNSNVRLFVRRARTAMWIRRRARNPLAFGMAVSLLRLPARAG